MNSQVCVNTNEHMYYFRQLVQSRDRIANGLKKLLETNDLVAKMEVLWDAYISRNFNNSYITG